MVNFNSADIDGETSHGIESPFQTMGVREGDLHLRFYLPSQEEFALPATAIREVMQQAPDRITPIPNTSPLLLGTINLRGQVVWVADLGRFLGSNTNLNTDRAEIPVIAVEDQETILGLAIESLSNMEWLDTNELQVTMNVPDPIAPYVKGEWQLPTRMVSSNNMEWLDIDNLQTKTDMSNYTTSNMPRKQQTSSPKDAKDHNDVLHPLRLLDHVALLRSARWAT